MLILRPQRLGAEGFLKNFYVMCGQSRWIGSDDGTGDCLKAGSKMVAGFEGNIVFGRYFNTYGEEGLRIESLRTLAANHNVHTFYLKSGELAVVYSGSLCQALHDANDHRARP